MRIRHRAVSADTRGESRREAQRIDSHRPRPGGPGESNVKTEGTIPGRGGTLIIVFALFCAVFAERAVIGVATGGAGVLGLINVLAPLVALIVILRYGASRTLGFVASSRFVFAVLPYLLLDAVLPILGVIYNRYPERSLWSLTDATTSFSFLVLGACLGSRSEASFSKWLFGAIVLQFAYALGQTAYLQGLPGGQLFAPFHDWDLSLQTHYGVLVQARASGLYFNPNELGVWAAVVAIMAWTMFPARLRLIGVVLAILTLALSQSRGASVALIAAVLVATLLAIASGRIATGGAIRSAVTIGLAILLAVGTALVIEPTGAVFGRFAALLNVATQGAHADSSLTGRVDFWSAVVSLNAVYPLGTWGPPELLLGSAIDSSWFRAFAQGSVPFLATLGLVMTAGITINDFRHAQALRLMTVVVAVAGLTEYSMSYPAIFLFWMLLGYGLQEGVTAGAAADTVSERTSASGVARASRYRPVSRGDRVPPGEDVPEPAANAFGGPRRRSPYGAGRSATGSRTRATNPSPGAPTAADTQPPGSLV